MGNSNSKKKSGGGSSRSPSPIIHAKSDQPKSKNPLPKDKPEPPIPTDQSLLGKSGIHLPKSSGKKKPDRSRSAPAHQKQLLQYALPDCSGVVAVQVGTQVKYWTDQTSGYNVTPEPNHKHLKVYVYLDTVKPIKIVLKDPANTNADWIKERFFEKVKKLGINFPPHSRLPLNRVPLLRDDRQEHVHRLAAVPRVPKPRKVRPAEADTLPVDAEGGLLAKAGHDEPGAVRDDGEAGQGRLQPGVPG